MTVEDIFMQHLKDPELSRNWIWSQLVEAALADSTRFLSDLGCQFYGALERDDRIPKRIVNELRVALEDQDGRIQYGGEPSMHEVA